MNSIVRLGFINAWASFLGSLLFALGTPVELNTELVVIALTGVIAVVSTLIGVINTAKNDAFRNSQSVNEGLREEIREMKKEHEKRVADLETRIERFKANEDKERDNRIQNDDYIRLLVRLLSENNIAIPPFIHPPT